MWTLQRPRAITRTRQKVQRSGREAAIFGSVDKARGLSGYLTRAKKKTDPASAGNVTSAYCHFILFS